MNLTWSAVARRIDELIASDRYMTETELAEYDLHTAAYAKYRNINIEEIVLVEQGGNYYTYRPDAEQVSRTLNLRVKHAGGLDYVVIPGEQLDDALEKLRWRRAVSYVDAAGAAHTLPFVISDTEREQYEKMLVEALVNDSAYVNAVRNSDRQNAIDEGFAAIRDAYKARCVNLGRHVTFDGGEGTALDVDEEGRLVVQGAEGSTHVFTGEVSVHGIYGAV